MNFNDVIEKAKSLINMPKSVENQVKLKDYYGRTKMFWKVIGDYSKDPEQRAKQIAVKNDQLVELLQDPTQLAVINDQQAKQGDFTLLHYAADFAGNSALVKTLLDNGADPFAKDVMGRTALHFAANAGDPESIELLLDAKKSNVDEDFIVLGTSLIDDKDVNGRNALHALCLPAQDSTSKATAEQQIEAFKLLLAKCEHSKGALEAKDDFGLTPADYAEHFGLEHLNAVFLENGISIASFNKVSNLSGSVTISFGEKKLSPTLEAGLKRDYYGRTKLMDAAFANNLEIIKAELEKGADPMLANKQAGFRNALHLSLGNGFAKAGPEVAVLLLNHPLTNPLARDLEGSTALHFAAYTGRIDTTLAILGNDEDGLSKNQAIIRDNINLVDNNGRTALHALAMSGARPEQRVEIARTLVKLGLDPYIRDNNGMTALDIAYVRDNTAVIKVLHEIAPTKVTRYLDAKKVAYEATMKGLDYDPQNPPSREQVLKDAKVFAKDPRTPILTKLGYNLEENDPTARELAIDAKNHVVNGVYKMFDDCKRKTRNKFSRGNAGEALEEALNEKETNKLKAN